MRRTYGRRRFGQRSGPTRNWRGLTWSFGTTTGTGTVVLISMEQDVTTTALTYDPPEDLTLMRIIADFNVRVSGSGNWTLGLTVQDTTWTPSSTILPDQDKRLLWLNSYSTVIPAAVVAGFVDLSWLSPGQFLLNATTDVMGQTDVRNVHIDISPKVKLEPGKALYAVAWEGPGTSSLEWDSIQARCLYQRTRKR